MPLPQPIESWVRENAELALEPANRDDIDEFAAAAAGYLAREYRVDVPARHILPTPGGRAAMTALIACVLHPGDAVMVTEPGYPAFARLADYLHAKVLAVPLDPENGFAPDLAAVSRQANGPLRIIAMNYPNNPTGAKLSPSVFACFSELVVQNTVLFNDATYGPLVYDEQPRSLIACNGLSKHAADLLELHSFSKFFPLGPIAVSFLAGSATTLTRVKTYSEFAWSPLSRLQLQATIRCMRDSARMGELRRLLPLQLESLHETLNDIGFKPYATPAGLYVICEAPSHIDGKAIGSAEEAARQLVDSFDLVVAPIDAPRHGYLRFSALYQREDLARLAGLRNRMRRALS
jgi:aspartate/methionine/tyrosine aminotransferase